MEKANLNSEVFTFQEARRYLKVSNFILYRLTQKRIIPASKVGRSWRFRKERINAWLDEQSKL